MDGTLGEIRLFSGSFVPRSWAFCEGQVLEINVNVALFTVVGAVHGGDGTVTFALPDLRKQTPDGLHYMICTMGAYPDRAEA